MTSLNQSLFDQSLSLIPGGVNSPVRAFRSVGGTPVFFKKGLGSKLWDVDGKEYIDYINSWGPMIVGHAHPEVIAAVQAAAANSLSFGAPTGLELEMAELINKLMPSMEQVRLNSSGTEATMSAIRTARGFTGRDIIVKFEGCYHGHSDGLLVKAGSGLLTFNDENTDGKNKGVPDSAGVPASVAELTSTLEYNNTQQLQDLFKLSGDKLACVIIEPVVGNMNLIVPTMEFLQTLRSLCTKHGTVLIFDEVMTGFRVALGGAQALYNITPDMTTLGKVIGGGLPVGAFGGRKDIMQFLAPVGKVYQAGTLSGNPVAVSAGLATLKIVKQAGFHDKLSAQTNKMVNGLITAAKNAGVTFNAQHVGGMFGLYFSEYCPTNYAQIAEFNNKTHFNQFFHSMLDSGIYLGPSAFEAGFVSSALSDADIAFTIKAAEKAFVSIT